MGFETPRQHHRLDCHHIIKQSLWDLKQGYQWVATLDGRNNKAVPMGFETIFFCKSALTLSIIKQSLWDLKHKK